MATIIDNSIAFLLLIATHIPSIYTTGTAVITVPPRDATVLFNHMHVAVFNCTGEGDQLQWTYDSKTVDRQIAQQRQISIVHHNVSDGMVSSSLYITATVDKDRLRAAIGCRIITFSPLDIVSAGAYLTVRCISPVRDLSLSIDDAPYVTWIIPSVIVPDIPNRSIRYNVTLERGNITSTVNGINDTYYQFTDITVLNCTVYTANVNAYDVNNRDVYKSDAATADNYTIETSKNILCISNWQ